MFVTTRATARNVSKRNGIGASFYLLLATSTKKSAGVGFQVVGLVASTNQVYHYIPSLCNTCITNEPGNHLKPPEGRQKALLICPWSTLVTTPERFRRDCY